MQPTRRQVLDAISKGRISGPELADQLGVSRAAVWKHVEALREAGFQIESRPGGYVLSAVPEFGAASVEHGLSVPFDVEYHDSIESTNDRARALAQAGESRVAVVADEQTGGRGRLDRQWTSPPGGLWVSLVCRPDIPPAEAPIYTLAAAVAATDALESVGIDAGIKWPNDVLVDGTKLVGILTEMEGEADRVSWIIVGIGINANVDSENVPETATTIREQVGDVNRAAVTRALLERFEELRATPGAVVDAWRKRAITLGRQVRVETSDGAMLGEAIDIEFPGTLVVATDEGPRHVSAGDCEHLRES
jgi:BirA family biotin operon repressor/biotin-[acetyl-CoA-carboxylase] ligase